MGTEGSMVTVQPPVLLHPILTQEQALLIHQALLSMLNDPEHTFSEQELEEQRLRRETADLVTFFSHAYEHPEDFPLRSRDDNKRILRAVKPVKGPAQPKSRRKRKQAKRPSYEKRTRAQKKAEAEQHNEARKIMEAEQKEAEEAFIAEVERRKGRFESIAAKEAVTNEELQEVLELFGAPPEVIERIHELRAEDDPQARLDRAAEAVADTAVREGRT